VGSAARPAWRSSAAVLGGRPRNASNNPRVTAAAEREKQSVVRGMRTTRAEHLEIESELSSKAFMTEYTAPFQVDATQTTVVGRPRRGGSR
jgi:hypothetical protein